MLRPQVSHELPLSEAARAHHLLESGHAGGKVVLVVDASRVTDDVTVPDAMEQRLTIVTLGVADVSASRGFYERLGWRADLEVEETVFFRVGGIFLILWSRAEAGR